MWKADLIQPPRLKMRPGQAHNERATRLDVRPWPFSCLYQQSWLSASLPKMMNLHALPLLPFMPSSASFPSACWYGQGRTSAFSHLIFLLWHTRRGQLAAPFFPSSPILDAPSPTLWDRQFYPLTSLRRFLFLSSGWWDLLHTLFVSLYILFLLSSLRPLFKL